MLPINQEKINLLRFGILLFAVAWLGLLLLLSSHDWRRSLYAGSVALGVGLGLGGYASLAQFLRSQFKRTRLILLKDNPATERVVEQQLNQQSVARIGALKIPALAPQGRWLHEVAVWGMAIAGSGIVGLNSLSMTCGENGRICREQASAVELGLVFLLLQGSLFCTLLLLIRFYAKRLGDRQGLDCFHLRLQLPQLHQLLWHWLRSREPGLIVACLVSGVVLIPPALLLFFVGGNHGLGDAGTAVASILLLRWLGGLLFTPLSRYQAQLFEPYQAEMFCGACGGVAIACSSEPLQTAFQEQAFIQEPTERIAHELDNISYVGWRCEQCQPEDVLNAYYWQRLRSHDQTLCPECNHDTVKYQVKSDLLKGADVHHKRCWVCYYHDSEVLPRRRRASGGGGAGTPYYGPSEYSFSDAGSGGECGDYGGGGDFGGGDYGGGESGGGGAGEGW